MTDDKLQYAKNFIATFGAHTRGYVAVHLNYEGLVTIHSESNLMDLSFMAQSLQSMVMESLSGRQRPMEPPPLNNLAIVKPEDK